MPVARPIKSTISVYISLRGCPWLIRARAPLAVMMAAKARARGTAAATRAPNASIRITKVMGRFSISAKPMSFLTRSFDCFWIEASPPMRMSKPGEFCLASRTVSSTGWIWFSASSRLPSI